MGIKYTGTGYLSSAISMSKELTKKVLVSEGVPMPKGISLKKGHKIEYVPYPCVVKPCCGGSSVVYPLQIMKKNSVPQWKKLSVMKITFWLKNM